MQKGSKYPWMHIGIEQSEPVQPVMPRAAPAWACHRTEPVCAQLQLSRLTQTPLLRQLVTLPEGCRWRHSGVAQLEPSYPSVHEQWSGPRHEPWLAHENIPSPDILGP